MRYALYSSLLWPDSGSCGIDVFLEKARLASRSVLCGSPLTHSEQTEHKSMTASPLYRTYNLFQYA